MLLIKKENIITSSKKKTTVRVAHHKSSIIDTIRFFLLLSFFSRIFKKKTNKTISYSNVRLQYHYRTCSTLIIYQYLLTSPSSSPPNDISFFVSCCSTLKFFTHAVTAWQGQGQVSCSVFVTSLFAVRTLIINTKIKLKLRTTFFVTSLLLCLTR